MADIIDIDVFQTVTSVSFEVEPNTNIININKVTSTNEGGGGGVTNLSTTQTASNFTINSDTGGDAIVPLGNGTLAGATLNDYTNAEKTKLSGIESGAEVNVNADWNATSGDAQILNKPTLTGFVPYTGATSDVNLGEFGIQLGNLEFDNTPTNIPTTAGSVYYNDSDGTLNLILKGGNVTLQVGQESVVRVVNKTSTNINLLEANYQAVRVTGAQGQRLKVDLAQATNDLLSAETIGLVTETINNNQEGFITTSGLVRNINTTGSLQSETWLDGDVLYLSPTVAGNITKVKPTGSNHLVIIGYVIYAHATQGTIFVKVDNGYELDELHNVYITSPLNNQSLIYETSTQLWKNKSMGLQEVTTINASTTNPIGVSGVGGSNAITGQSSTGTGVFGISDSGKGIDGSSVTGVGVNGFSEDGVAASFETNAFSANIANFKKTGSIVASVQNNGTFAGTGLNASGQTINTIASFDGSKNVVSLSTATYPSLTELTYVKGVTSAIQTQLNAKQPINANLTSISALSTASGASFVRVYNGAYYLDNGNYLTSVGIANLTATGTPSATTYLRGDNTWATVISGATNLTYTASPTNGTVVSDTGTDATLPLADATNAGLLKPAKFTVLENTSGTNTGDNAVNSLYSGLSTSKQDTLSGTGFVKSTAGTISYDTNTYTVANTAITAATNTKITYDAKGLVTAGTSLIATDIPTITQAQVTNLTTDLTAKAPLASPAFTGNPTATTQTPLNNSTRLATTAYVEAACAVVAGASGVAVSSQDTFGTANIATVTTAQYNAFVTAGTVSTTTLYFITA